jgi:RNA polymerase sigma-70 factor (ECF subfamily)
MASLLAGSSKNWANPLLSHTLSAAMNSNAEAELLARCRRGDAAAWDELFDKHYAAAGRFIFQLGSDFTQEDVEEICQEVFLTVIKSLHTFEGNSQFQTWLFRIAANRARDYRQRQHAIKRGGGQVTVSIHNEDPETGFVIDPPSHAPGPDLSLLNNEKIGLIGQALEQLGGACQEIIELRYFADLSYEEISKTLDLNVKTVSSRLSKCLGKLEMVARQLFSRENSTPTSV